MEENRETKDAPAENLIIPMEVDEGKTKASSPPKWLDLRDQSSRSLSMFLLIGLVLTFICWVVWIWYFKNKAVFTGWTVTNPMTTELVTFPGIVCSFVILGGLYGVKSIDRGWLLVTIIGQIALINTLHFGMVTTDPDSAAQLKRIDAVLLSACIFTAWAAWRTSEKIQEEQLKKQRILTKDEFLLNFGLDLPDLTITGMEQWLIGTSICFLVFGIIFIILGALSETNNPLSVSVTWHMITCGSVQIVAGSAYLVFLKTGVARARISLTITMMLAMLGMIMVCTMASWLCFQRAFFAYECEGLNAIIASNPSLFGSPIDDCYATARLSFAQVLFQYFSLVLCALHVWLSWRLSERVQMKALHDQFKEKLTNVSVFSKGYMILGIQVNKPYTVYMQNLLFSCFFIFAAGWGFLGTWFILDRIDTTTLTVDETTVYSSLSGLILDNYINVIVNFLAVITAMFGVYDNDRGFLLISTLLFFTATGYNYHNFLVEYSNWDGGFELPENWIKDLGRVSSFCRVITLISAWFGAFNTYVIAEIYQERDLMRGEEVSL